MTKLNVCGRSGLAKILDASESQTRNLQKAGEISPVAIVGGRPLFSVEEAHSLRAKRDARRKGADIQAKAA